ncbi:MAG: Holliday junction resolvase RuvX [Chloroflexi bacterium AL-W]|nr:Holliday junction resolvase RuvX [Chloroflexi bacterium AL-N1]NOK66133.1 Holliday junction resolvase RuvX [Chloroflexi bacterium AL-N10]NOK73014.1 Holliday junction resolvase RuvX [Chloroflexi bacterium AL-N5]NOK79911.1 Holliday junction resolvase RuvX [Chloroflexi bacterium AL-W]NOK88233.1 Holliday junction resolvase RuvX [Chloroflexi bacterium AL-N15]
MTNEPGRAMAIDVGGRRIGVALSDTTRLLASPLTTVHVTAKVSRLQQITELIEQHEVTALVVGLPLTLSGEVGPQAEFVQTFVDELREHLTIPIHLVDERLTTVEAERLMVEMGVKRDRRREQIDAVAASIILRDFLGTYRSNVDDDM